MATLTEISYQTRRVIKYGAFFVLFLFFLRIAFTLAVSAYRSFFPPPPPPPTVAFGKLTAPSFPEKDQQKYSFLLQTKTGELPKLPETAKVYFMPLSTASFLDLENAKRKAASLGFAAEPERLSETIYRFTQPSSVASIDMNIVNGIFSLNYNLSATPELLILKPDSTQNALSSVHSFLSSANLLTEDLKNGEPKFEFIKFDPPELVQAISLSEANFIRVNLFRQNLDDLPILTPDKKRGNVWFLVSGSRQQDKRIIAGEYHYFPVDTSVSATYPIRSAEAAWDELTGGKAYIASTPEGKSQITIRRIYLAYYDSGTTQQFLHPIIVFEGDDGFTAYILAVASEWLTYPQE